MKRKKMKPFKAWALCEQRKFCISNAFDCSDTKAEAVKRAIMRRNVTFPVYPDAKWVIRRVIVKEAK